MLQSFEPGQGDARCLSKAPSLSHAVHHMSEDEAIALMSVARDFGVTQVVDANWGVHGSIRKNVFMCT